MSIAVSKVGHLVLRVSDLGRSIAFYEMLGLHEVAGDSLAALADARTALDGAGLTVHMALDHTVSQGLYISDPDAAT